MYNCNWFLKVIFIKVVERVERKKGEVCLKFSFLVNTLGVGCASHFLTSFLMLLSFVSCWALE